MQINQEGQLESEQTVQHRVSVQGNKASTPLALKVCGGCGSGKNSQPHGKEIIRETHRVLEPTQNPWNQHQKGSSCKWVEEEVTESQPRAEQVVLLPLGPLPQNTAPQHNDVGCPTLVNT